MYENFFGFCLYTYVKSLVKNHVWWNDFHCAAQTCVDEIISITHPSQNKVILDPLTLKRCWWSISVFLTFW